MCALCAILYVVVYYCNHPHPALKPPPVGGFWPLVAASSASTTGGPQARTTGEQHRQRRNPRRRLCVRAAAMLAVRRRAMPLVQRRDRIRLQPTPQLSRRCTAASMRGPTRRWHGAVNAAPHRASTTGGPQARTTGEHIKRSIYFCFVQAFFVFVVSAG